MKNIIKKPFYCSSQIWKKIFLFQKNSIFKTSEKIFFYNRSSVIPNIYVNSNVLIYMGKRFTRRFINQWMVGFKFGEFTWNRKIALYKAKQIRKKKRKSQLKSQKENKKKSNK